jgi:hypothetical protein
MLNNGTSDQELQLLIVSVSIYYILLPLSRDQNEFSAFFCNSLKVIETHALAFVLLTGVLPATRSAAVRQNPLPERRGGFTPSNRQ